MNDSYDTFIDSLALYLSVACYLLFFSISLLNSDNQFLLYIHLDIVLLIQVAEKVTMQDEAEKAGLRRNNGKEGTAMFSTVFKIAVSLIMILMLLWTIYIGFLVATIPRRNTVYNSWIFYIGVVTVLFGSILLILGLPILAELLSSLSNQFPVNAASYDHGNKT